MKKLPIGIQTFKKIINEGYIYVDKTKEALDIIENYQYVFLSRPRRFGKSLFLDTLKEIFQGNRELFKGLYIYNRYSFEKYPVIKISWSGNLRSLPNIEEYGKSILRENCKRLGVELDLNRDMSVCLKEIIQLVHDTYNKRVVVLVDEYDRPILDNIDQVEVARDAREFLKGLYGILKDADEFIRFVFITGVSRFSRVSIFSGINNLEDISLNPDFAYICGYKHENLEKEFKGYMAGADLEEVKNWYNGYNFLGKENVYNPFDILLFVRNHHKFKNYWFSTGTPTFLIKLIKEKSFNFIELENLETDEKILESFDIDKIDIEPVMFQTGYLTIKEQKQIGRKTKYVLTFPNIEVRMSFNDYLLDYLVEDVSEKGKLQDKLYEMFSQEDISVLEDTLKTLFAAIPYTNYIKNQIAKYEGFYASIMYAYFAGAGFNIIPEDISSKGRADLTVIVEDKVYLFEFKVRDENPIKQIKEKRYYEKYLNNKSIYAIGIIFDNVERNIKNLKIEKIK